VCIANNTVAALRGMTYRVRVVDLDGTTRYAKTTAIDAAPASQAVDLGAIAFPDNLSAVHFVKLELLDASSKVISNNFYWRETRQDDLTAMDTMADVQLESQLVRHDAGGNCLLDVTLKNTTVHVAVMAHVQLRNGRTNLRVLPVYYSDNYVSLLPGESTTITIEAALKDVGTDRPLVTLDGWNVTTETRVFPDSDGASIATNGDAQVDRTPGK
jgi:beta-mannosidase